MVMTKGEQMLADLGYEAEEGSCKGIKSFKKIENKNEGTYYKISFDLEMVDKEYCNVSFLYKTRQPLDFDEILACAEIVKELRENEKE